MMPSCATTGPKTFAAGHAALMAVANVVSRETTSSKVTVPLVPHPGVPVWGQSSGCVPGQ